MRKLFFYLSIALFLGNFTPILAQNYLAFNSEDVRTSVDGAANDYFSLNVKNCPSFDIQQRVSAAFFIAKDGLNTPFYGLNYGFAYPISAYDAHRFYVAVSPAFFTNRTKNGETGKNESSFGLDIPIVAEWHFGAPQSFGGLLGLGVAYNYIDNKSTGFSLQHKAFGPRAEAGINIPISGKSVLLKSTYQLNLAKEKVGSYSSGDVLSISLGIVF